MRNRRTAFIAGTILSVLGLVGCEEEFPMTIRYDAELPVELSKETLIERLNAHRLEAKDTHPFGSNYLRANYFDEYFGHRLYFKTSGYKVEYDSIPVVYDDGDIDPDDQYRISERRVPSVDTHYISPDGHFRYRLTIPDSTEGRCDEIYALLQWKENKLLLELIRMGSCTKMFHIPRDQPAKEYMREVVGQQLLEHLRQ